MRVTSVGSLPWKGSVQTVLSIIMPTTARNHVGCVVSCVGCDETRALCDKLCDCGKLCWLCGKLCGLRGKAYALCAKPCDCVISYVRCVVSHIYVDIFFAFLEKQPPRASSSKNVWIRSRG